MRKGLRKKRKKDAPAKLYVSTGSTLLNLACTGRIDAGFLAGHYYFYVGDSNSGKTWLAHTLFAEASIHPAFDSYRLIYDGVEGGALMDVERYFGKAAAERIEPPEVGDDGSPIFSGTAESFYFHVADALEGDKPFIYVLDSQDSLSSDAETETFETHRKAHRDGKEPSGSYGDNKAKVHSAKLRRLMGPLLETGSILLILNQTRDSFDVFQKSSYSGGKALMFYATLQLWSSVSGQIKRTYKGKKRQLGIKAKIRVKKNRVQGRDRTIEVPILHSAGLDDIGSCLDYLVDENVWDKRKSGVIVAKGLGPEFEGLPEKLIREIEEKELENDVRELVGQTWASIEDACKVERRSRYG